MALAAGVVLIAGRRPAFWGPVAWLLLVGLQVSCPPEIYGADATLRLLLMWYSLVELSGEGNGSRPRNFLHGSASLGLALQSISIIFVGGLSKLETDRWLSGSGLAYSLDYSLVAGPMAIWIRSMPVLDRVLTWFVLGVEVCSPLVIFIPSSWPWIRGGAVAFVMLTLVAFLSSLEVGWFPVAVAVGLVPLLPEGIWSRVSIPSIARDSFHRFADVISRVAKAVDERIVPIPMAEGGRGRFGVGAVANVVGAVVLAWLVGWQAVTWSQPDLRLPPSVAWIGDLFWLKARWGTFTADLYSGWFEVPGKLADGTRVNLFAAGGPLPSPEEARRRGVEPVRPSLPSAEFQSMRWQTYFIHLAETETPSALSAYAGYLCRSWNQQAPSDSEKLESVEIVFHRRPATAVYPAPDSYERHVMWTQWCLRDGSEKTADT